ncbi:MAG: hypothetical protein ACTTI6_10680 [Treponema sp.]|uniref:hypothetical protein n=1 Tax=Treponema sp. TaxID=166 RepID=UPI003FA25A0B
MNLLLYWGNAIWGIEFFGWIVLGVFGIDILFSLLIVLKEHDALGAIVIGLVIDVILYVIFRFLHFPVKGTIITLLIIHIINAIISYFSEFEDGDREIGVLILPILYVIGDIIGMVLFFKNVL